MKRAQREAAERERRQPVALAVQSLQAGDGAQVQRVQAVVPQVQLGDLAQRLPDLTLHLPQPVQPASGGTTKHHQLFGASGGV